MEGFSTSLQKGFKGYWRRRGYQRLNDSGRRRRNRVELASNSTKRRRLWRIKVIPRLKSFRVPSPKRFFVWLRDAYVKMMLSFANSRMVTGGYGGAISDNRIAAFGKGPLKEYDEKMIIEIYKSLVIAQGQVVATGSDIVASSRR